MSLEEPILNIFNREKKLVKADDLYSKLPLPPPKDAISAPPIRMQLSVLIGRVAPEKFSL